MGQTDTVPVNGHLPATRHGLLRKIRLRTLVVHQVLARQAEHDEQAAALVDLVDDIATAAAALTALDAH
jgi:hypothetical protein